LQGIIAVPFLMPTIVVAISLDDYQRFFRDSFDSFTAGLIGILVAHVFLNMGLIIRSVGSRIASLDEEQIEAAKLDGADGLRLWREIIFPQLRSTVAASSVLVFLCKQCFGVFVFGNKFWNYPALRWRKHRHH
jgi:thiamine transport system permease protein